ncbi:carboxynorspermidine decarboxylase [Candidatus Sumerlaeota bacterium]|nr:carboxynorspermidine decarboxylase [Candidatus Sumerlaeota bacterium]
MTTPYYLIDEKKLLRNLKIVARVREKSGAKCVLALKCFSTWCVFDLMREYLDGTTSSSPFEARLGYEKFGREVHAYSVGFSRADVREVASFADKVTFNSISQLERHRADVLRARRRSDSAGRPTRPGQSVSSPDSSFILHPSAFPQIGLRVNPGISYSHYDLADPARRYSRLGVRDKRALARVAPLVSGLMFHFNCENDDFAHLSAALDRIGREYGAILKKMEWVSLGGGIAFTAKRYPLDRFCARLRAFADEFGVQVYLEPGEAVVTGCTELVTTVLDVVLNEIDIAIVDASTEAHTLDHLIYRTSPKIGKRGLAQGRRSEATSTVPVPGFRVLIAGRSCLAGDVFGEYRLKTKLKPGDTVRIADAAGYTMVKKNWFNGLAMPSIRVKRLDGKVETVRSFTYEDYEASVS